MRVKLEAEFLTTKILTNCKILDKRTWQVRDLLVLTSRIWIVFKKQVVG